MIVVIIAWGFVTFVAQRTQVSGASMETTLSDGDQLIVDKISYQFREPERFEIIVFPYQYEAGTYYIKRIIGLPGETVQILDGSVYINGEKLEEHYGNEVMEEAGIAAEPVTLGVDEYFVMGDNRNNSQGQQRVRGCGSRSMEMDCCGTSMDHGSGLLKKSGWIRHELTGQE